MSQPKFAFTVVALLVLISVSATAAHAQSDTKVSFEPSYDVVLQVIVGSNDARQGAELPADLAAVSKHLRSQFSFANYGLANTYFGRVAGSGTLEYKSVSNLFRPVADTEPPSFVEWSFGSLKTASSDSGRAMLQAQPFRFGARIPLRTGSRSEDGKTIPVINYESIGINLNRVTLPERVPTLIGTLILPDTAGTLFLVMTAKPAEY